MAGRQHISQGSSFEERYAYTRAVVDGRWVFVSGTTGFDYSTMMISDDFVAQVDQALANIADALERAGSSPADIVRVTYLVPTADDFDAAAPSLQRFYGESRPAATMLVAGLIDPRIKIEIEVTALKPEAAT